MKVDCAVRIGLPPFGQIIEGDWQFRSSLVNTTTGESSYFEAPTEWGVRVRVPTFSVGDEIRIEIPSGDFEGTVKYIEPYGTDGPDTTAEAVNALVEETGGRSASPSGVRMDLSGTWDGRHGGLDGGLTGFGTFTAYIPEAAPVESSAFSAPVPWSQYCAIKAQAHENGYRAEIEPSEFPTWIREEMRRLWLASKDAA